RGAILDGVARPAAVTGGDPPPAQATARSTVATRTAIAIGDAGRASDLTTGGLRQFRARSFSGERPRTTPGTCAGRARRRDPGRCGGRSGSIPYFVIAPDTAYGVASPMHAHPATPATAPARR